ncbi:hypothetical protein [Haloarcula sp. JP-L23]|uniref:hypothetical protein n=1 Tax=Haloarcula sp. JP-L23 TaxID=2716717 RepID=UPI00140EF1B8|nr:hypothetical protein G9465_07195 [Haloarcula sp. JP-L23]
MERRTVRILRAVAAALVFATAAFHLWWGLPRSIVYFQAYGLFPAGGIVPDPRPYFFVVFAVLLLSGPYLVTRRVVSLRNAYIGGTLLLVGSIAAWVFWHATGHGAFLASGADAASTAASGHSHGSQSTVFLILDHFDTEPLESAIKTIEFLGVAIFVTLLWKDPAIVPTERSESTEHDVASEN